MDAVDKARDAIVTELQRQSEIDGLNVEVGAEGDLALDGQVDLTALATAVVGAIAGGP